MTRISDPLRNVPDVLIESKAAGFAEIGQAVFDMLAAAVGRITSDPDFASLPSSQKNMRAAFVLYRSTHSGNAYAQGKWRPRVGGALNISTAANWGTQVAAQGHAVLSGYPILHVLDREEKGRPSDVWVLDVVMDWVSLGDLAFEPVRVYFGARPARVSWSGDTPRIEIDRSRSVEGELPVTTRNAPVTRPHELP